MYRQQLQEETEYRGEKVVTRIIVVRIKKKRSNKNILGWLIMFCVFFENLIFIF